MQILPEPDGGVGDPAPRPVHRPDVAPEAGAFLFDLVNLFGALRLEVEQAADFALGLSRFLLQLGDLEGQLLHVTILVGAVRAVFKPVEFFLFGGDVSVELGELLGLALVVVGQAFELVVHALEPLDLGLGVLRGLADAIAQVFSEVALVGLRVKDAVPEPLLDVHDRARRAGHEVDELALELEGEADSLSPVAYQRPHATFVGQRLVHRAQDAFEIGERADGVLVHPRVLIDRLDPAVDLLDPLFDLERVSRRVKYRPLRLGARWH